MRKYWCELERPEVSNDAPRLPRAALSCAGIGALHCIHVDFGASLRRAAFEYVQQDDRDG